jgi:hypothetical protein
MDKLRLSETQAKGRQHFLLLPLGCFQANPVETAGKNDTPPLVKGQLLS